ncbi:cache domain-containing protein [Paenibacillus sp. HB172176]|uniref:helix-turn-helix domain-containing protein n=1 Tax=Paenibacillus sp. HB172176 TaxID=2493690 RepID=UPI00143AA2E5|nr:cache domain-containing protein [Paenibacillus sp. HB172176]
MRGWKKHGVQRRWLQSYAIVLLIPIVMMTATYLQTRHVINDEINRANSALLSQLQQEIDNYTDYVYRLTEMVSLNAKVTSIISNQDQLDAKQRLDIVHTLADFKSYNIAKRFVDHFYIYFNSGDFVLTDSSYYETEMYYSLFYENSALSLSDWRSFLSQEHRGQFINMSDFSKGARSGIMYTQSLPFKSRGGKSASTLVIELNQERLMESIRNLQAYNQGKVYILDEENRLLASSEPSGAEEREFHFPQEKKEASTGTIIEHWDGEKMVLSYTKSSLTNWKIVYALPSRLYSQKAEYVRNISILTLAIAAVVGSIIAVLLARRNYHPLQKLIRSVAARSEIDPSRASSSSEYDYLEEALDNTLGRYQLMNQTIETQNKALRSNLIARLLKGRIKNGYPIAEMLPEHGMTLQGDQVAVLLFYIEDYSGFFRLDEQDAEKKREFVHLIMTNIVEELAGQEHQGWMSELDEMLVCIVNFKGNTSAEEANASLKRVAEEAQRFIGSRFKIFFTVSVSSIHRSAAELPTAYQEAMEAMEYRMLQSGQSIIWHDQIKHQELSYDYSIEKEQQLINYVNAGDYTGAKATLDAIIDGNLEQENVSADLLRCLLFDMCSTMMKAGMEANLERDELYEENLAAIRELSSGSTVSAMRERMSQFLYKICLLSEERRKSSKYRLKDRVLDYIEEHYKDNKLGINMISEHFGLHPSYMSRFFKEQAGDTLTDYMNRFRVEKSKELLLRDDIFIKDISDLVGFYSISTYIRLFKKYEGVTPSAYRESGKYQSDARE